MKNVFYEVMVTGLIGLALGLPVSRTARANETPEDTIRKMQQGIDQELGKVSEWNTANSPIHSPEYSKTGIGVGAGVSSASTDGLAFNGAAAFESRIFKEGSQGKPNLNEYLNPTELRRKTVEDAVNSMRYAVQWSYDAKNPAGKRGTLTDDEAQARIDAECQGIEARVNKAAQERLARYDAAYARMNKSYEEHASARPLYLFEGGASYNMIGKSQNSGAYTGVTGSLRGGLGFTFKDFGKNGCDIYFLGTGNAEASGYYKLQDSSSARVAVGIEQGVLCQIANTVTIMGSPSVQAGKFAHSSGQNDTTAVTDWLNYSARVRAIVDGRLYVAVESVLHPSMKKTAEPGSHWKASENSVTLDYALANSPWVAGADLKFVQFHDENAAATGMKDIHDDTLMFHAIRAF